MTSLSRAAVEGRAEFCSLGKLDVREKPIQNAVFLNFIPIHLFANHGGSFNVKREYDSTEEENIRGNLSK
jgi:hypothetical protein